MQFVQHQGPLHARAASFRCRGVRQSWESDVEQKHLGTQGGGEEMTPSLGDPSPACRGVAGIEGGSLGQSLLQAATSAGLVEWLI